MTDYLDLFAPTARQATQQRAREGPVGRWGDRARGGHAFVLSSARRRKLSPHLRGHDRRELLVQLRRD